MLFLPWQHKDIHSSFSYVCLHLFPSQHCLNKRTANKCATGGVASVILHDSRQKMGVLRHQIQEFTCRGNVNWGKAGSDESISYLFSKAVPPWSQSCVLPQFHLHSLVLLAEAVTQGLKWQLLQLWWSLSGHSDWRILPGREVVYSSPPPFPVPNQVRLIQQTSNGKKKSVLKYSQDYNRKH